MIDKRKMNFFMVENKVIDDCSIEPTSKLLYMVLARYCNNSEYGFPGIETLIKVTGIKDKRTITKHIKKLEESNLIKVERKRGKPNKYFLTGNFEVGTSNVGTSNVGTSNDTRVGTSNDTTSRYTECTPINNNIKITNKNNSSQSVGLFISTIKKQFNVAQLSARDETNIISWCKELKLDPMMEYEKSSYLQGLVEMKPLLRMFYKKDTYIKMKNKEYRNNENTKEKQIYSDKYFEEMYI